MANIAVIGIGYVGAVSAACLARDGHVVVAVDVDPGKVAAINAGKSPIVEKGLPELIAQTVAEGKLSATTDIAEAVARTEACFVCVGTPSAPDGSIGLDYVKSACAQLGQAIAHERKWYSVIMRSTIVPGSMETTCIPMLESASGLTAGDAFGVGYYPEFLRESTAIEDHKEPGLIVFGSLDALTGDFLTELNKNTIGKIHSVDLRTAEMVKYTSNSWRAVKVTYANEIGNIAKASGIDGQLVMRILCSDNKAAMSPYFMRPGFAFGGSCLPKDVRALRALGDQHAVETPLLDAVLVANDEQIARAEKMLEEGGHSRIGMVGISFKPGTDDLRESPLATLAARLIEKGREIKVYDPYVNEAYSNDHSAAGRGNDYGIELRDRLVPSIQDLLAETDVILVGNSYAETLEPLTRAMDRPIIDLTRISPEARSNGVYEGICW
ncbi:nucleotide sugar dehydrogenase [Thioclava sp. GXIMD4215]|uniref:nucleotide sugar dehydrogenase n=1 Tax=Thioclava sp. GXIMD4215 TaxID=3131928 RepID=UPI003243A66E